MRNNGLALSQSCRWMKRGHEPTTPEWMDASTQLRDANFCLQQCFGRKVAERHDDLWINDLDLSFKPSPTCIDFNRFRVSVVGRTALHDICDVKLRTVHAEFFGHQRVQQLPGTPDERLALEVLVRPWSLTHEQQVRFGRAHSENNLRTGLTQIALGTSTCLFPKI
jgi:hypothetical protein